MIALLLACGGREALVDERRVLDTVALGGQTFTFVARHRGWHHGAGADGWPHLPYDVVYVSATVETEPGVVRGDTDPTWAFEDPADAAAAYAALGLERCASDELVAWRVTGTPWRILVPDGAGAAGGLVEDPVPDCAGALLWAGSAATWRRDRAAHPLACAHLARMRLREAAIRCLLRSPGDPPTRQDLPGAMDDPEFDRRLLEVLSPATPGDSSRFAAERVLALLAGVEDREAVRALAQALAAVEQPHPWQTEVARALR